MNRRAILRSVGAVAAGGLAGCVDGDSGSPGDGAGGTPTGTPADTPTEPATSFAVTATRCGTQVNQADVAFGGGTVTVEGQIWGNDACYTGRLESVTMDDGTLTVRVVAVDAAEENGGCAQCISEIEYRATVETATPTDEVVVIHDGETVRTATPT